MPRQKELSLNSILGRNSEFTGDFVSKGSVRIDGSINGNVKVDGTLIVGVSGSILGNVEAQSAVIGGEVIGNITTEERTELAGTAKVIGDIVNKIIVIDENAVFQGNCNMNIDTSESKRRRPLTRKDARAGRRSAKEAIQEALKEVEEEERKEAMEHMGIPKYSPEGAEGDNVV